MKKEYILEQVVGNLVALTIKAPDKFIGECLPFVQKENWPEREILLLYMTDDGAYSLPLNKKKAYEHVEAVKKANIKPVRLSPLDTNVCVFFCTQMGWLLPGKEKEK